MESIEKRNVVSGIRPTGFLHLGNYFGAIQNFVKMQYTHRCFFFIADLHSLTTHPDTSSLASHSKRVLAEYMASGLDPQQCCLYTQSSVPETSELYLYISMLAYKGELEKTASFKEKIKVHNENINAGLLTYPILMAADILLHKAHFVPVGKDQEQHLEMTRTFANRLNFRYNTNIPEPVAFNFGETLIKIPSLDGIGKMSKSENENATIYLSDSDENIIKKIMKAKTDAGPIKPDTPMPDYIQNIFFLLKLLSEQDKYSKFLSDYNNCNIRYGDLKKELAEDCVKFIQPIREKTLYFLNNESILKNVLQQGEMQARESAQKTMSMLKQAMRLNYF